MNLSMQKSKLRFLFKLDKWQHKLINTDGDEDCKQKLDTLKFSCKF